MSKQSSLSENQKFAMQIEIEEAINKKRYDKSIEQINHEKHKSQNSALALAFFASSVLMACQHSYKTAAVFFLLETACEISAIQHMKRETELIGEIETLTKDRDFNRPQVD
jgi:hypothetical protein